jgi:Carboxypeptidase regulatory-like domain/Putative zinc-finger
VPKPTPDQSIDQLLKTTLRADTTQASADCLDGETLAAWSEGTLSPKTSQQVEVHLADCARCQALVAAFVRTEPVLPAAVPFWRHWSVRWVVPLAAAASLVLWISRTSGRNTTAPSSTVARVESPASSPAEPKPLADAATNERQEANRGRPSSASAAADKITGFAQTADARRSKEAELQKATAESLAKRQVAVANKEFAGTSGGVETRADQPAAPSPSPPPPPGPPSVTSRPQSSAQPMPAVAPPPAVTAPTAPANNATVDGAISGERRVAPMREEQTSALVTSRVLFEVVSESAPASIDAIASVGAAAAGGGGGRGGAGFGRGAGAGRSPATGTLTGTLTDAQGGVIPGATVRVTRGGASIADAVTDATGRFRVAALEPGDYQIDITMSGFRTASRSNVNVSGGTETVVDAAMQAAPAAESVQMKSDTTAGAAGRPAAAPAAAIGLRGTPLRQVAASATRWRVFVSGRVERSIDGGQSWESISIDPPVTLTGGSSPSRNVCWLIGQRGVILLASDGIHFARVPFPETTDIVSVRATDAQHATVTTAPGRTFTTADGGRTWRIQN